MSAMAIAKVQAAGKKLPHEWLHDVMNGERVLIGRKWHIPTMQERQDAGKACAPYYAAKLASVEHHAPGLEAMLQPPDDATVTRPAARRIMFTIQQAAQRRLADQRKQQQQPSKEKTQ